MDRNTHDCVIVGGGIVGLSIAHHLLQRTPGLKLAILEKESQLATHQSGRNSGVIHSGIYYEPGSLKARFAREGTRRLIEFCRNHGIEFRICGKVIVATEESERPQLHRLFVRAGQHGLRVAELSAEGVRAIEPHVRCLAGIHVPETGIVNYRNVCRTLADVVGRNGGYIRRATEVRTVSRLGGRHVLKTTAGDLESRFVINCAGLHSDRVARLMGLELPARIVPFRGEYYELIASRTHLVRGLIYPVPNPAFPFLGVHFTKTIEGSVHAGPNAVLALKREGYFRSDFNLRDSWETFSYRGFWALAGRYYREGLREVYRSLSKAEFVRSLQRLVPAVEESDLVPSPAGVRAQALRPDGQLVDDFLLVNGEQALHVLNAPSPAATAALAIGDYVAGLVPELRNRVSN